MGQFIMNIIDDSSSNNNSSSSSSSSSSSKQALQGEVTSHHLSNSSSTAFCRGTVHEVPAQLGAFFSSSSSRPFCLLLGTSPLAMQLHLPACGRRLLLRSPLLLPLQRRRNASRS
jgi:hypothetical protein